jgi:acyl dehydratase
VARVLHRDQKLKFHRPIKAGDRLYFDSYLDSVLESHGMVTAEVRAEVTDADGEPVATSIVTMIGEAEGHETDAASMAANIASHRKA